MSTTLETIAMQSKIDDAFSTLGAVVPKGVPMQSLLKISESHADLLAALRQMVEWHPACPTAKAARAAIAKCEGQP
jgi:hypothetical protein